MSLTLYMHPLSSYCHKALIALYENGTPFAFRMLDPDHPENGAAFATAWPLAKFPLLIDGQAVVMEATCVIEHLAVHHPGPVALIPADPQAAVAVRMLDRIFDNYVMTPMQKIVGDALRPDGQRDGSGVAEARDLLGRAYAWLEGHLAGREWAADAFSLADCAAAPALFYADWVEEIGDSRPKLSAYRARLLAHPAMSRCVEDARPYRAYFPLGAPDRD